MGQQNRVLTRGEVSGVRPPVRIVYVIDSLRPGGAERHLVRILRQLRRSGQWDPTVYCLQRRGPLLREVTDLDIEVAGREDGWSKSPLTVSQVAADLWLYLARHAPAIVHCYLPTAGLLGTIAARLAGVPHVVTTRRTVHTYAGVQRRRYQLVRGVMDRGSDAVIAVCEAARVQALGEGTPPHKIVTVYNAVERSPYAPWQRDDRFQGQLVFGAVGTLHRDKGHGALLEAAPQVLRTLPQARFILVGDGPERAALEKRSAELGVGSRVEFWGTRLDIQQILPDFDVFVLPSLREGLPNALLEAMAAGLAVVATGVGGVPEVVQHGRTGLLVSPAAPDELARTLIALGSDPSLRKELGRAARIDVANRFSPEQEFRDTEAVYLRLLNQTAGDNEPMMAPGVNG